MTPARCFLLVLEVIKWPSEIHQSMEKYIYFQTWLFGVTGKAGNGKRDRNGNGNGNENLREAAGAETTRSSRLLSSREPGMSRSKDSR